MKITQHNTPQYKAVEAVFKGKIVAVNIPIKQEERSQNNNLITQD